MLTTMTDEDWTIVLQVFPASRSRRGDKGRDDRKSLESLLAASPLIATVIADIPGRQGRATKRSSELFV